MDGLAAKDGLVQTIGSTKFGTKFGTKFLRKLGESNFTFSLKSSAVG